MTLKFKIFLFLFSSFFISSLIILYVKSEELNIPYKYVLGPKVYIPSLLIQVCLSIRLTELLIFKKPPNKKV